MNWLEPLAGVGLVMALLSGAAWVAARQGRALPLLGNTFRPRNVRRRLELVEHLPLTPNHALHLIELDSRPLLIATYPGGACVAAEPAVSAFPALLASATMSPLEIRSAGECRK